jgi:uncharacterized protein YktB (UPF0637 family)
MKAITLTRTEFDVFTIDGFAPRMDALKTTLRPRLTALAQHLCPRVTEIAGHPMFVHVAKHARRTVNAPDETWAAFAHASRGYKKLPHFALAVSRHGVHARLVLKDEAIEARTRLSKALSTRLSKLSPMLARAQVRNYEHWGCENLPEVLSTKTEPLREMARVTALKTGVFDAGVLIGSWKGDDAVIEAFEALMPLYSLAISKK